MVPVVGVEPTRVLPQQILSLPCFPISTYRHVCILFEEVCKTYLVLPAVIETTLSLYKRPVLTIKLREYVMVTLDRLELPTHGLGNHCSIHLSYRVILAERVGFEPTVEVYLHSSLAGKCNKPLYHLSKWRKG